MSKHNTLTATELQPICVSVAEARKMLGLGLTTFYAEVRAGRIALVKCGRRSLVTVEELRAWPSRVARAAAPGDPAAERKVMK